jgi:tetratricopeptide (TPR) repeat protein
LATRFGVSSRPSRLGSSPSSANSCLIKSCIALFYICSFAAIARAQSPDALYAERGVLANAKRAAELWQAALAENPKDFDAAWKLARADYWLGNHAPEMERRAFLERGIDAGKHAVAIDANRPEGHFWIGANMGTLAESFGLSAGLKYRKPIKEELETTLRLDPAFQQGSADRALGRWYFKVPGLFGGSHKLAEEHFRKSLTYNPNSTATHYFLAELLLDGTRKDEARTELRKVVDAPVDPEWAPEDRDFKEKAQALLAKMK